MTNELILDIASLGIVLIFVCFGLVRGIQREIFSTASILGGWAVASAWEERWREPIADLLRISERTAGFVVVAGVLFGSFLLLGIAAGGVIGNPPADSGQRIAGALLAGVNAVLLLSYSASVYTQFLSDVGDRRVLNASRVASVIRDEYAYILVGAMVIAVLLAVAGLIFSRSRRADPLPYGRTYPTPNRRDEPSSSHVDYKVEPSRKSQSHAMNNTTMPIPPVDPGHFAESGGRRQNTRFQPKGKEWSHVSNRQNTIPIDHDEGGATSVACVACGRVVTLADVYCPFCGKLTR